MGFIRLKMDFSFFYSEEGTGRPLVFCYGLVCSSLHWTYQIEFFRKKARSIWFDYRGHHNSETPKDLKTLTIETFAKDLGSLFKKLKLKDAVLLGHSMGVNVALEFAKQFPDKVSALVLCNGTANRPLETMFRNNLMQGAIQILKKSYLKSPELIRKFWKFNKGNPLTQLIIGFGGFNLHLTPKEDIQRYVDQIAEMDPEIFIQIIENYEAYDCAPWLHTIEKPTLIIGGEDDKITPFEEQELLHQLLPQSRLEKIAHGSHCSQMDLPELVNLKIDSFLKEIGCF